eukprot:TRINITY_DN14770_c0_g1_i1.p1 TRINITY_DN14770_c0_g1~~TRINITY_DN14770_c0_g1_i1.p1  ORF type:complete len:142 (+),score=24.76 TRINITY_DN14770_c0_g1_i1:231-656(+)
MFSRLVCDEFPTAAQNERRALEILGNLIRESKRFAQFPADSALSLVEYEDMFSADNFLEEKMRLERAHLAEEKQQQIRKNAEKFLRRPMTRRQSREHSAVLSGIAKQLADAIPIMNSAEIQEWAQKSKMTMHLLMRANANY